MVLRAMNVQTFRKKLLAWYRENGRENLPWRQTRDPYSILVSEAMLQQTQVSTVIPYYHRFLKNFPTVQALAQAPVEKVLDSWAGLGYYSRAKNLQRACQKIVQEMNGRIPKDLENLLQLPGVGRYTAGAVSSIAFGQPSPILDGNVIRVLTRYFGIQENSQDPFIREKLWEFSEKLVPSQAAGDFNQALMDLGATVCTSRAPECLLCPLIKGCQARKLGIEEKLPIRSTPIVRKRIDYFCGIVEKKGSFLMARRPIQGLLGGLWEFPGGEKNAGESVSQALIRLFQERLGIRISPESKSAWEVTQLLTHRQLSIQAYRCRLMEGRLRPRWYLTADWISKQAVPSLSLTAGMRKLSEQFLP